jgi:transposase
VYLDESGIDTYLSREHVRAPRGMQVYRPISGMRYARESFIAAQRGMHIIAPFCYRGTCNTDLFNVWIKNFLVPELRPGQVVIMDNATFHKSSTTKRLIEEAGCRLLFLPPYSPDLNPIELLWANLKKKVRGLLEEIKGIRLHDAIDRVLCTLSS